MNRIVIGSAALKYHGVLDTEPKDLDVVYSSEAIASNQTLKEDWHIWPQEIIDAIPHKEGYATPDAVYTIKCSHFEWDIKWVKTKSHILLLKHKGCKLIPDLYSKLKGYWISEKGYKERLCLNKSKQEFFDDAVMKRYEHDYLHELIAFPEAPKYTLCLREGEEVLIDKGKFDLLSFQDQVKMFREEICVIALERYIIPLNDFNRWQQYYSSALKKVIVSLTKNWASEFIVLNLNEFHKASYKEFEYSFNQLNNQRRSK